MLSGGEKDKKAILGLTILKDLKITLQGIKGSYLKILGEGASFIALSESSQRSQALGQ